MYSITYRFFLLLVIPIVAELASNTFTNQRCNLIQLSNWGPTAICLLAKATIHTSIRSIDTTVQFDTTVQKWGPACLTLSRTHDNTTENGAIQLCNFFFFTFRTAAQHRYNWNRINFTLL